MKLKVFLKRRPKNEDLRPHGLKRRPHGLKQRPNGLKQRELRFLPWLNLRIKFLTL